jgi:hypothetical protein
MVAEVEELQTNLLQVSQRGPASSSVLDEVFGTHRLTATIASLNWWARNRAVRTEYAAISGERLKPFSATLAVIKELAGVRGHVLSRLMAALRAGDCGVNDHADNILQFVNDRYFRHFCLVPLADIARLTWDESGRPHLGGLTSVTASVLRQNVWRRMMMRYAPFTSALGDKHGEARWTRYRFALYHPGKRVKAGDFDSVIVDYDCAPFVNRVFVAGSFCGREISYDRLLRMGAARHSS